MNGRDLKDQPALPSEDDETAYNNPDAVLTSEQSDDSSSTSEVDPSSEFSPNKKNRRLKLGIILLVLAVGVPECGNEAGH